ncbi:MAG: hypothetical protein OYH76_04415 [Defluviicoccus sp.]|nr:hypothetical protein [Defluviicoccus sp.]MDE0275118.1 hypothetical protein [Defluviicoccus sp.]
MQSSRSRTVLSAILALTLAACGGGGSGDKMSPPQDQPNGMTSTPQQPNGVTDTDGDGVADAQDAFPNDPSETADSDRDGVGDNADAFPRDASETADADGDGVGDNADAFPNDATASVPTTSPRPSPNRITTVGGNQLSINYANSRVVDGQITRRQIAPGVMWEPATEYPVVGFGATWDTVGEGQYEQYALPSRPADPDSGYYASYFFYGRWSDTPARLQLGGHQNEPGTTRRIATFAVNLENDEIRPWLFGVKPLTDFVDNPDIRSLGTANYDGILVGFTTSQKQPMASNVEIELDLGTAITGTFELDHLSTIEKDGELKPFLGGTLQHDIAVTGNTFTTIGGDPGTVTGIFAGEGHEAAAGTFQHPAFTGVFSADNGDAATEPTLPPSVSGSLEPPLRDTGPIVAAIGGTSLSLPSETIKDRLSEVVSDADSQSATNWRGGIGSNPEPDVPVSCRGSAVECTVGDPESPESFVVIPSDYDFSETTFWGIMTRRDVKVVQGRGRIDNEVSAVVAETPAEVSGMPLPDGTLSSVTSYYDFELYGGWADHHAFLIDLSKDVVDGQVYDGTASGVAWGDNTGSAPVSGSAVWRGVAVAAEVTSHEAMLGDATLTADFTDSNIDAAFTNMHEVKTGAARASIAFDDVPFLVGGTFASRTNGRIVGRFYGPNHAEAGGIFERGNIVGAFGTRRQ